MTKNKYTDATNERKWNYVFLLHVRYKGSFSRLARAMGIPQAELKNWDAEYKQEVIQWVENEKVLAGYIQPSEDNLGPVPDEGMLIEKLMRRLNTAIDSETDPSKLSRALETLQQLQTSKGAKKTGGTCPTVSKAIEERLNKGGNNG